MQNLIELVSEYNPRTKTSCVAIGVNPKKFKSEENQRLAQSFKLQQDIRDQVLEILSTKNLRFDRFKVEVYWGKGKNDPKKCEASTVAHPFSAGVSDALVIAGKKVGTGNKAKATESSRVYLSTNNGVRVNAKLGANTIDSVRIDIFNKDARGILREAKCIPPGTTLVLAGSGAIAAGAATIISTYGMAKSQNQIDPEPWTRLSTINTTGWIVAGGGAVLAGIGLSKRFTSPSSFAITPRWNARIGPTGLVIWTPL